MKEALEGQQQQIQQLRQELQSRDQAVQQMQQRLDQAVSASPAVAQADSKADAAAAQSNKVQEDVTSLRSNVSDLKQNATNTALSLQETQTNDSIESRVDGRFTSRALRSRRPGFWRDAYFE
jgi:outer membrane protein TolC